MTAAERELGRRWFEEVWNNRRREAIAELLGPNGVIHDGGIDTVGPEGFYPFYDRINRSFSDLRIHIHQAFAEGDLGCVHWSCTARHTGDGLGIPASGKMIDITGMIVFRAGGGMIQEAWQNWDMLGLMEQIHDRIRSATYIGNA